MTTIERAIEVNGLYKSYGGTKVLQGIDLQVAAGTVYAVLGPNGAGKTTLVSILSTLLRPDSGSARVFGMDIVREADAVRGRVGLTGQFAAVDEGLTGRDNLMLFGRLVGYGRKAAAARADQLLQGFGLTEAARKPASQYSGGMRRRLDIAAASAGLMRMAVSLAAHHAQHRRAFQKALIDQPIVPPRRIKP